MTDPVPGSRGQPQFVTSSAAADPEGPLQEQVAPAVATVPGGADSLLGRTFYTLRYREFRLFWIALIVSLLGVSFQTVAQGWLVYRLTGSALMLGLTGFIPAVLAAPASLMGGLLADRVSRRNLVIVTQSLMMLPPVTLALLIWGGQVEAWHVIAATSVLAMVAAVDLPSRTSMVPHLVPEDDLLNAQGLASAVGQLTRIVGPALAGIIIARWGEALPYMINGMTYLAMVGALLLMRPIPPVAREGKQSVRASLFEGFGYTLRTPIVLGLFIMVAAQGVFLSSYIILLPVFAKDILQIGPEGLGWLTAAVGIGALTGALGVANLGKGRRGGFLTVGGFILPLVLAAFAWSGTLASALPFLLALGAGTVLIRTVAATFLLTIVPENFRGRVISLATLIFYGAPYAAGLPVGYLTEQWGPQIVLSVSGLLFLATMAFLHIKTPQIRYQE